MFILKIKNIDLSSVLSATEVLSTSTQWKCTTLSMYSQCES